MKLFSDENYVQNYEREEMLFRSNVRLWKKEGRKEANYGVAKKMLLNNKSPEEIYLYTDIPVEKLTKLKLELKEEKVIYNKNNDMLREHHNKVNNQINLNK